MNSVETSARLIIASQGGGLSIRPFDLQLPESGKDNAKKVSVIAVRFGLLDKNAIIVLFPSGDRQVEDEKEKSAIFNYIVDSFPVPIVLKHSKLTAEEAMDLFRHNQSFICQHGELDTYDINEIRSCQYAMLAARAASEMLGEDKPLSGDIIEGAYYNGVFPFKGGAVVNAPSWGTKEGVHFCAQPYVPWIAVCEDGLPSLDCSGGPFFTVPRSEVEYVGEDIRYCCCWGHNGPCANGAIHFPVKVKRWRIKPTADY